MTLKETNVSEIVDYFIKCWKEQKFPAELKITSYESWRLFRQFWLEHSELELDPAISYYLQLKKSETL